MNDLHCSVLASIFSVSASHAALAPEGTSFAVVHMSALDTTAFRARIVRPLASFTPVAAPSSTTMDSTLVERHSSPPPFSRPRISASMMAPEPPTG